MVFLNKKTNISTFHLIDDILFTFDLTGVLSKYLRDELLWIQKLETQHFLLRFNSRIIFSYHQFTKIVFIDSSSGEILFDYSQPFKPLKVENNLIWGIYLSKDEFGENNFKICTFNEKGDMKVVLQTGKSIASKISGNYIHCQNGYHNLSCYKISEKKEIWQLNIQTILNSEEAKLFGDILEYKGRLIFFLSDFSKDGIFSIDIETGKVINQTNEIGGYLKLANDIIYINNDYVITALNPITFEFKKNDFTLVLKPLGLNLGRRNLEVIVDNLYYFVSESNGRGIEAFIGIIDLNNNQLVKTLKIPIEIGNYWVKEIQVHDNRLFVLTQGGTLHIFEKE